MIKSSLLKILISLAIFSVPTRQQGIKISGTDFGELSFTKADLSIKNVFVMAARTNDPQYSLALAFYGQSSLEDGVLLKVKIEWGTANELAPDFQLDYSISDIRFSPDGNFILIALQQKTKMNQMFLRLQTPNPSAPDTKTYYAPYSVVTSADYVFERGGKILFLTPDVGVFTSIASKNIVCDFLSVNTGYTKSLIPDPHSYSNDLQRYSSSDFAGLTINESEFRHSVKEYSLTTVQDLLVKFTTSYCAMGGQLYNGQNVDQSNLLLVLSSTNSGDCWEAYLYYSPTAQATIEYSKLNQQKNFTLIYLESDNYSQWYTAAAQFSAIKNVDNLTQVFEKWNLVVAQKDLDQEFSPEMQTLILESVSTQIQLQINTKNKCRDNYFNLPMIYFSFILDPDKKQQSVEIPQLAGFQKECYNSKLIFFQNEVPSTSKDHTIIIDTSKVGEYYHRLSLSSPLFETFYEVKLTILPCQVEQILVAPIALSFENQAIWMQTANLYTTQVPSCQANISYRVFGKTQEIDSGLSLVGDMVIIDLSKVDLILLTGSTYGLIVEATANSQVLKIVETEGSVYISPDIISNAYQACVDSFKSLKFSFEAQIDLNQSTPMLLPLTGLTDLKKFCNYFFVRIKNNESFISMEETSLLLKLTDPQIAGIQKLQIEACKGNLNCSRSITSFEVQLTILACQVEQILLAPIALSFDSPASLVQQTTLQIQQVPSCMAQISLRTFTDPKFPGTIVINGDILSVDLSKANLEELSKSSYTFTIEAEADGPTPVLVQDYGTINISPNLIPLEFIEDLQDQHLAFNSTKIYTLPSSKYRLPDFKIEMNLDNNRFRDAISLDQNFQFITISATDPEIAGQTVYVTLILIDDTRESKYTFMVSVDDMPLIKEVFQAIEDEKPSNSTDATVENSTADTTQEAQQVEEAAAAQKIRESSVQTPQKAKNSEPQWVSDFWVPRPRSEPVKVNKFQVDYPLPKFDEVGQDGQVAIKFSKPLKEARRRLNSATEPDFSKMVDVSILRKGSQFSETTLNFTWSLQQVSDDQLGIKMMFQDVFQLQDYENERYQLQVVFNGTFTAASGASIPKGTAILVNIPPQLPNTPVEATLTASTTSVQSGMNSLVIFNFLLSFAMQVSLSLLWGLINCLQLFVHLPLLNISFPPNANMFMTKLIDVASFDMFPMD